MTEIPVLISKLRDNLESAAFLVSKADSEKEAHSTIVQSLVCLAQIEANLNSSAGYDSSGLSKSTEKPQSGSTQLKSNQESEIAQEVDKVRRRIPKWLRNPSQNNSQIMLGFLELSEHGRGITIQTLKTKCQGIKDFEGNYNQMKNFGEKNHGKVFDEIDGVVTLWEPVSDFICEQYNNFRGV